MVHPNSDNAFPRIKLKVLLLAVAVVLTGWSIYLVNIGGIGIGDWSWYLNKYEAIRKTILDFHQFPFWNPWHCGGTPLYAHPEVGVFSLETLCALLFGTVTGLNIAMILYVIIGCFGMYICLSDYTESELTRYWGVVLFGLQGVVMMHLTKGHTVMLVICWFPWILFLVRRVKDSLGLSLLLGIVFSIIVNTAVHYLTVLIFLFSFFFLLVELVKNLRRGNKRFFVNLVSMVLVFFALSIYKIILCYTFFSEYPRLIAMRANIPAWMFITGLVYPLQHGDAFPPGPLKYYWAWHEIGSYVGIIAVVMFVVSFFREIKWWQIVCLLSVPLVLNSTSRFLPGYWIRELPVFSSMFCIGRWRFFTVFFLIIGSCRGFDYFREIVEKKASLKTRKIPLIVVIFSTVTLLVHSFYHWGHYGWRAENEVISSVPIESKTITNSKENYDNYAACARGVGVLMAGESLLGYSASYKTPRMFYEDEDYLGELVRLTSSKPCRLDYSFWSPNKLVFTSDGPGPVVVNQNPGNYWLVNQKRIFSKWRSFEQDKLFVVYLSGPATVELTIVPPWHRVALNLTLFLLLLLILDLFLIHRYYSTTHVPSNGELGEDGQSEAVGFMGQNEYVKMFERENEHWWYCGLHELLLSCAHSAAKTRDEALAVLDAGCGTGRLLERLTELPVCNAVGFDASQTAIELAGKRKIPDKALFLGDITHIDKENDMFDVVISCDVLSSIDVDQIKPALLELHRVLRPGGFLFINLPAFPFLAGEHDVAVNTRHRFRSQELREMLASAGFDLDYVGYRNFFLFIPILVIRLIRTLSGRVLRRIRTSPGGEQSDLDINSRFADRIMIFLLRAENHMIRKRFRFPFGVSLFAIARKPNPNE